MKLQEKSPLVILTGWSFGYFKGIWNSQDRKRTRDHNKREEHENGRDWKLTTRDAREDCPNDENGGELDKKKKDY